MKALVDTNLLVLLIVGRTDGGLIQRQSHKALKKYTWDHYVLLQRHLLSYSDLVVIPHVLAETSNIASQITPSIQRAIRLTLAHFVMRAPEVAVASADSVRDAEYLRFGLVDVAILAALDTQTTLLTDDLNLAYTGESRGLPSINFNHLIDPP